jgi:hypothetical protein
VGPNDVPVAALRAWLGDRLIIGYSTDDPAEAVAAVAEGADYLGCGAVFGTTTKDVGSEAIGIDGLEAVASAVQVPVVGIGGVDLGQRRPWWPGSSAAGVGRGSRDHGLPLSRGGYPAVPRGAGDQGLTAKDTVLRERKTPLPGRTRQGRFVEKAGGDVLSHRVSPAVPSALRGLTAVFGMGTGVALAL